MRREHVIALLLAAAALVIGVPLMVAPQLFPDLGRPILWALFIGGAVVTAILVGTAVFLAIDKDPAAKWRRRASGFRSKVIRRGMTLAILLGVLVWYLLPLDPLRNDLPGFTTYVLVTIHDYPDFSRRYIYKWGGPKGPRMELLMSASNAYIFAVTDVHGETYPLEMNVGENGIRLETPVSIFTEYGLTKNSTILRVLVDGKEIRRTLPFPIDMRGPMTPGTIGSDESGGQHGNFVMRQLAVWQYALNNRAAAEFDAKARKEIKS